jgi:hypothetical protein
MVEIFIEIDIKKPAANQVPSDMAGQQGGNQSRCVPK